MTAASRSTRQFVIVAAVSIWASNARGDQRVLLFNQNPVASFAVLTNGSPAAVVNSSSEGVVAFTVTALPGDSVSVTATGTALPPSPPGGLDVTGDDLGCAHAAWTPNPEGDVIGYRIYYGDVSVAGGGTAAYADSADVMTASADICGLTDGTYYFAVRAFNAAGLLGSASNEVSASVSTGNAQPPLPPLSVTATEAGPGCIDVAWLPTGDPTVTGYIVDYGTRSVESGDTSQYDFSVDVGGAAQTQLCGLSAQTYFVAVRAKNNIELISAYSGEQTVQMSNTPVYVTSFDVSAKQFSVLLRWRVWSDEALRGIEVYRSEGTGVKRPAVLISGRLDPTVEHYVDAAVRPGTEYTYRIVVVAQSGELTPSNPARVRTRALEFALEQNTPNPFNPSTSISFVLPNETAARLEIFDVRGSRVAQLHVGRLTAGRWSFWWDGTNRQGSAVSAGTYFYRLRTDQGILTRKMILVK